MSKDSERLECIVNLLVGCKWADIAALDWYKPEFEKYVTRSSLLAAIDSAIADKLRQSDFAREQSKESVFTRKIESIVDVDN